MKLSQFQKNSVHLQNNSNTLIEKYIASNSVIQEASNESKSVSEKSSQVSSRNSSSSVSGSESESSSSSSTGSYSSSNTNSESSSSVSSSGSSSVSSSSKDQAKVPKRENPLIKYNIKSRLNSKLKKQRLFDYSERMKKKFEFYDNISDFDHKKPKIQIDHEKEK